MESAQSSSKHEADLKALFGDSEDELSDIDPLQVLSDEDEQPLPQSSTANTLPKFKRKTSSSTTTTKKQTKKSKTNNPPPPQPSSPNSAMREQVKQDIDNALFRINPRKSRKQDLPDEAEIDETMIRMVSKMKESAQSDQEENKKRLPAIHKVRLLPIIAEQLTKTQLAEQFLDNHLLEGIKAWLEPLPDGSLPVLDIQKTLLRALHNLPIRTEHLRESGLGRIIMFYSKCKRVQPEVKKNVDELLDRWMRPIMKRSDNYRDRVVYEKSYDPRSMRYNSTADDRESAAAAASSSSYINANSYRVSIPAPLAPQHDFVPRSTIGLAQPSSSASNEPKKKDADRFRKIMGKRT